LNHRRDPINVDNGREPVEPDLLGDVDAAEVAAIGAVGVDQQPSARVSCTGCSSFGRRLALDRLGLRAVTIPDSATPMHKAHIRRERRPRRPLPHPDSPATPASGKQPGILQAYLDAGDDRRRLKAAAASAIAVHSLLFFVVIPRAEVAPVRIDAHTTATVLRRWEPPAPPSRPSKTRPDTREKIPVPWTPLDEPRLVDDTVAMTFDESVAEFAVGLPEAPPGPPGARHGAVALGIGDLQAPVLLEKVVPDYTPAATRAGIQGRVYIEAVIAEDGAVVEPVLLRGLPDDELNRRALDAIKRWRFRPGERHGRPVKVIATFTIDFSIH
jgi:TonB family protein